jgi:hypothetical protein
LKAQSVWAFRHGSDHHSKAGWCSHAGAPQARGRGRLIVEDEARRSLAIATGVDREAACSRLAAVRDMLKGRVDTPAEDLLREMRDVRTRDLSR